MATFNKINGTWRAQVRRKGVSKSGYFRTKAEAQAWALDIESKILTGAINNSIPNITFAELLDKYIKEISIKKRSYREERLRLLRLMDMPIGSIRLPDLHERHFQQWRDERLSKVSAASVLREWNTLSHVMTTAVTEWKYLHENHLKNVKRPETPKERSRRYSDEEIERLTYVSGFDFSVPPKSVQSRVGAAMLFAIETAMRAGEICKATWADLNAETRILHIPTSKNGHSRDVPLSTTAIKIITHLSLFKDAETDLIFNLDSRSLDANFRLIKERAGLSDADLHFHDTRREALSRLSQKVEVMTLAKISGHRDIKILLNTYYAPKMEDVVNLLD
ncbi:site-specific integrase [Pasteurella bettyae]|uniref:Site-specific recombinase, phage integrase family n=1 Tax=Pasteurella bettyae CCUG 2042 TaxID=1095749 RepID=I3DK97_9PAST|nr:site-specific integrase [Pasteurella bettyae]EIJ72140.1 site-specific recombinase, phage integrase family [Pasteurella bettyae CCUG 2042]SUB20791.1 putative integrase/recombinase [Pasteurella bettyae]